MKFTNRHKEMARLDHLMKNRVASLAVVWGRRRVGKTRLLLKWIEKNKGVYYVADESAASIQRKYFSIALDKMIPGFSEVEYSDWNTFFSQLARNAMKMKWNGPIVIDELPYLIYSSPELPSILQKFIDHEAKKAKLLVVLCGSSQKMMKEAALESTSPLYGRADELLKLAPISIGYMKKALKIKKDRDVVESYAIWGGIPRYWDLVEKNKLPLLETIDKLILDPMGPLNEEPNRILLEESSSATQLRSILDAIGLGANRVSEIASRIKEPVTSLTRRFQHLLELDLIQKEIPYGSDEHNSKKSLYKIKDPFVRFWFEAVAPKRSAFSQASSSARIQWIQESLPSLFSLMWEELCRFAVPLLSKKLGGKLFNPAGRFWEGQGPEWDVLSESNDKTCFLIGESKWIAKAPSSKWIYQAIEELKNKGIPPVFRSSNSEILYVLFVPEKPKKLQLPVGVKVIEAKEVIEVLV